MKMSAEGISVVCVEEGLRSLVKEVKKTVKAGRVILFAKEGREGDDALAAFSHEGFKVDRREVKDAFLMRRSFAKEEECRQAAIIGVGGRVETEAAKEYAAFGQNPVYLYPTDLSALSAFQAGVDYRTVKQLFFVETFAFCVVYDRSLKESREGLRSGLGSLFARMIECMDGAYDELMRKKRDPAATLSYLRKVSAEWKNIPTEEVSARVLSSARCLSSEEGNKLPFVKSATTLSFLAAAKKGGRYDDYLFPAAYALFSLYRFYLSDYPLEHCPPPDRVENAARIEKMAGLDAHSHLLLAERYADVFSERGQLTGEYREDFLSFLAEDFPLAELCKAYRRAPGSKDVESLCTEELLELLSLTGEEVSGYALVKHIKQTGLLEPLLLGA